MKHAVICSFLKKKKLGMALFLNLEPANANFSYVSGFGGLGVAVVPVTGKPFLLVPEPEYHIAKREASIPVVNLGGMRAAEYLKKKKGKLLSMGVGVDYHSLTVEQFKWLKRQLGVRVLDVWPVVRDARMVKSADEVARIRKACVVTEKILDGFRKKIKGFATEAEAAAYLSSETQKRGAVVSFPPIVATGTNTGKWHHSPSTKKIGRGFLLVDFGIKLDGYCSDLSRTCFIGKPTAKEREEYEMVRKVQSEAISMMKPGVDMGEVQAFASKELGKRFCHSLGHGIGVEVHELPHYIKGTKLKEGMVLAVEPGVYTPYKFGIRIEDDVVITKTGAKRLNGSTRTLILL